MQEFATFDAKNRLSALLDLVEQGEEVMITRYGRPVAKLVSANAVSDHQVALAAAARIRARAAQSKGESFDWTEWKGYRDQGRP
ncbi:MAG: type II toxin-antitoxin system prevent-host-death family antitoxin [Rhodospirillaceae bacterium]